MRLGHEMLIAWDELGAQVMCFCIHVNVFMWSPCARAPACTTLRDGDNGRECTRLQSGAVESMRTGTRMHDTARRRQWA